MTYPRHDRRTWSEALVGLGRAIVAAVVPPHPATLIQDALVDQKRWDVADHIECGSCGGLGVVIDLANRWYEDDDDTQMLYGGKPCPECSR